MVQTTLCITKASDILTGFLYVFFQRRNRRVLTTIQYTGWHKGDSNTIYCVVEKGIREI